MPQQQLLFFGTPQFAATILQPLIANPDWQIAAVVTQPDKPRGRGQQLMPTEVKSLALQHNIPVFQPLSLNETSDDPELARLREFLEHSPAFDAFLIVAYGRIVPRWLFSKPRVGSINVHGSILPRWRGAAPIQHAILAGDATTGVCIMQIDAGLDSGPVFSQKEIPIASDDTTGSLHDKLAVLGAELLVATLPQILAGTCPAQPQPALGITYATKWEKKDTVLRWNEEVSLIARRIRACAPFPGLRAVFEGEEVKLLRARVETSTSTRNDVAPGTVVDVTRESIKLLANGGVLCVEQMQFPGKRPLEVKEILKGRSINTGAVMTEPQL